MYGGSNKRAKLNLNYIVLWRHFGHISKKCIENLQHDGFLDLTDIKSFEKRVSCSISKEVENQLGKTIKSLRSDRGGGYMSQGFFDHLKEHEIIAHRTPTYTRQHNGVSWRRNRTLLDMVRSMMSQTTLLKCFWDYALESAACILNMVPTKNVDNTPYEVWHGQVPKLSYLKVWGCVALVKPENKVFVAWNAEFFENDIIKQEVSESLEDLEIIQKEDTHPSIDTSLNHKEDDQEIDEPQSDINPIRRSTRTRRAPYRIYFRILIAIAVFYDYVIWQMDVKTAFLNRYLNEENITCCFQNNPSKVHWTAVKNIPKYLHNTKDMFLFYGGDTKRELRVSCYTDVGYLTDADDMKSQTGYVFVLNGGAVDRKSTKQSIFAITSIDAEYIAPFDESKEAVWIQKFISRLGVVPTIEEPINLYCDNTRAITIAKDHGVTKGARHFRAKVHYLRETIEMGDVRIEKVNIDDNLADPFTKALAFSKHSKLTKKIGMIPPSSLM
uniref:Integrase catalytic domain-containing protein n=1 Tax=Tanacetum cinerariifolium TaxID=118510 RepID=A0A699GYE2_TANCI|nr:hypothetical protein [Tanacetum cinerariifolium]